MEFVATTVFGLAFAAALFFFRPEKRLAIYSASIPFSAAATVNLPAFGGTSIVIPAFVGMFFIAAFILHKNALPAALKTMRPYEPGFFLAIFALTALGVTFLSPRLFQGMIEVYSLARIDGASGKLAPLGPSTSNVTQTFFLIQALLVYMVVSASIPWFRRRGAVMTALTVLTGVHLIFMGLDAIDNMIGGNALLSWMRTANYRIIDDSSVGGIPRLIGGFAEASGFAYFTLGLFGFWFVYWAAGGAQRAAPYIFTALGAGLIMATSSSGYAALGIFMLGFSAIQLVKLLRRRSNRRGSAALILGFVIAPFLAGIFALLLSTSPAFFNFVDLVALSKLESSSGVERSTWNEAALGAVWQTGMLGLGVGSVRTSSIMVGIVASTGLIGTVMYAAFLGTLFTRYNPVSDRESNAVIAGCKAGCIALFLLAAMTHSSVNMGAPFYIFAGVIAALTARSRVAAHVPGLVPAR